MLLEIHKLLYAVPFGETIGAAFAVLMDAPDEVIGHADIKSAVAVFREDVDVVGAHERDETLYWTPGTSPGVTKEACGGDEDGRSCMTKLKTYPRTLAPRLFSGPSLPHQGMRAMDRPSMWGRERFLRKIRGNVPFFPGRAVPDPGVLRPPRLRL